MWFELFFVLYPVMCVLQQLCIVDFFVCMQLHIYPTVVHSYILKKETEQYTEGRKITLHLILNYMQDNYEIRSLKVLWTNEENEPAREYCGQWKLLKWDRICFFNHNSMWFWKRLSVYLSGTSYGFFIEFINANWKNYTTEYYF